MSVAVVGLGAMGAPMARCLIGAGIDVTVFDVRDDRIAELAAAGGRPAASPADAAAAAETVLVMVATGEDGLAAGLGSGSTVIVTATVGIDAVKELEAELATHGVAVVDAAVSGGVARAETGDLLVMVGAGAQAFERCRPLLAVLGGDIVHCGEHVGDGQAVKLVNQLLCGVHLTAAAEAFALARALGLAPERVWEILRRGAAGSFMLEHRGPLLLATDSDRTEGVLSLFLKDMDLVVDAAARRGLQPLLSERARELFRRATALGREDDAALIEGFDPGAPEELAALGRIAGLELSGERMAAIAADFEAAVAERDGLRRAVPDELPPHMAFDPRWD